MSTQKEIVDHIIGDLGCVIPRERVELIKALYRTHWEEVITDKIHEAYKMYDGGFS